MYVLPTLGTHAYVERLTITYSLSEDGIREKEATKHYFTCRGAKCNSAFTSSAHVGATINALRAHIHTNTHSY